MPEFIIELLVLIVTDLQQPVLDPKSIGIVIAQLMPFDLDLPILDILAVKQLDPFALNGSLSIARLTYPPRPFHRTSENNHNQTQAKEPQRSPPDSTQITISLR